ncbi:root storage protein [Artemisia annua]|uniref:Root storage protein n=1 Tax=Artemisia annua TaxID=35608 RepID=A0A2U1N793_ARTAN|nr:root storage protein [Artemisia annua]
MAISNLSTYLLLLFFLEIVASVSSEMSCVYTIFVKTGTADSAGTDATISLILNDAYGSEVNIPNLDRYGEMDPGHNYFENGNIDKFSITTSCMKSPVCSITLSSDNSGGTADSAGTDATISLILNDAYGSEVNIPNLDRYGEMDPGHNYFENGNIDKFSITTSCMKSPVCSITLSSDNSGGKPGWYVDYVQVVTSKGAVGDITFEFYGWLAEDEPPYKLTRTFDRCAPPTQLLQITDAII